MFIVSWTSSRVHLLTLVAAYENFILVSGQLQFAVRDSTNLTEYVLPFV